MKKKQLKIGVILSYVSLGANMIIHLLYTPVMIHLLGQSEYGLYTLVGSVVSYLSLFSFGFTGAYLRFYSRYKAEEDQQAIARLNGMFLTLFLCMSTVALICGMVLSQFTSQLFGDKLTPLEQEKARILMQVLVINIALTFPSSVFDSIVSAHEQFLFQRLLQLAGILFNPLICLPLLLVGFGSVAVVTVTTLITVTRLAVSAVYCLRKLHVPFLFRQFDTSLLKEIAGFSFFLFLNMIIDQVNWSVDKFILGRVAGTVPVAVYGVGAQINSLVVSFSTAISSVFAPRINLIAAQNTASAKHDFTELFIKVGRIQFLVLGLVISGFVFFGRFFIIEIYAGKDYEAAYFVVLWLVLPSVIPLIQNTGIDIQRAVNKHQFRSAVYFAMAVINTLISIPLAIYYGPVGSAAGTGVSVLLANGLIMNLYYHKAIGIDIFAFWKSILRIARGLILPTLLGGAIIQWVSFSSLAVFAGWIIFYTGVYVVFFWLLGMDPEEKKLVLNPLRKITKWLKSS